MKFFDLDSPIVRMFNRVADLIWLNVLTMICSIPLVTAGAAFTALHYMSLKLVRNEESYITKGYFKSFKENFKQSTVIWLILLVVAGFLGTDLYIIEKSGLEFSTVVRIGILILAVIASFTAVMIFPVQARFANPIKATVKNAFVVSVLQFPKTFLMLVLLFFPFVLTYLAPGLFPLAFALGFSLPAYLSAFLYNKTFLMMEQQLMDAAGQPEEASETEEDERIFKDELDESLAADENMIP